MISKPTPGVPRPSIYLGLLAWLATGLMAVVLAGCGPGVGGTGAGNEAEGLVAYGAMPSSVCSTADFTQYLSCGGAASPASGTKLVFAADGEPTSRHLASFEGSKLTLDLRCSQQQFIGEWARAPQLGARYYGTIVGTAPGAVGRSASVIVTGQGSTLVLLVQDFAGARIGELLLLQRVNAATAAASCG
jgi:hypothetical protein